MFLIFFNFIFLKVLIYHNPADAKSLAIPRIPKQSGLFGVIDNSITFFFM